MTTGSALFAKWAQHPAFLEKEKDALAIMAAAKNELLSQKFGEIVRSWKILEGMFIPLLFLLCGIILESVRYSEPRYLDLRYYLAYAAFVVAVLIVLCPLFAWLLANSVDDVLDAALDGAGANVSISLQTDRSPISQQSDALRVAVKLVKGERGSADLQDAKGRVSFSNGIAPLELKFDDVLRLDFDSEDPKVVWDKPNVQRPQIRFAPGGAMEMSTHCLVPATDVCKIEVVILGSVLNVFRYQPTPTYWFAARISALAHGAKTTQSAKIKQPIISQWRASSVSLPTRSVLATPN